MRCFKVFCTACFIFFFLCNKSIANSHPIVFFNEEEDNPVFNEGDDEDCMRFWYESEIRRIFGENFEGENPHLGRNFNFEVSGVHF